MVFTSRKEDPGGKWRADIIKSLKTLSKEQQAKALRLAALLNAWTGEPEKSTLEPKAGEVKQSYVPIVPDKRQEPEEPYVPVQREPQYTYELQENEPGVALEEPVKPFLSEDQEEADLVSVLQVTWKMKSRTSCLKSPPQQQIYRLPSRLAQFWMKWCRAVNSKIKR